MVAVTTPPRITAGPRMGPAFAAAGAATLAIGYISMQLRRSKTVMDQRFAQYNNEHSEEVRRKTFEGTGADPRTSLFNILGHDKTW